MSAPVQAMDLAGSTALVTGGTRGLGLGLARALGRSGVRAIVLGRDEDTACATAATLVAEGMTVEAVAADVTDAEALHRAVAPLGAIDLLVCAAGVRAPRRPVWEATADDYRQCFDINVLGVVNAMAAVMPGMVARRSGNVVAIGGTYGHKGVAGFSVYAASKWALRGLVRSAALDAAPHGVRVNMVSPGGVEGEAIHAMFRETARRNREPEDAPLKRFLSGSALGRLVSEDDVAAAVLQLAGPAGRMITGQDILVDAGTVV